MLIHHNQLIGLAVKTEAGTTLGEVGALIYETDAQMVYQYEVKPRGLTHLFAGKLLIHRDQVISITEKEMTVEDAVYKTNGQPVPVEE